MELIKYSTGDRQEGMQYKCNLFDASYIKKVLQDDFSVTPFLRNQKAYHFQGSK